MIGVTKDGQKIILNKHTPITGKRFVAIILEKDETKVLSTHLSHLVKEHQIDFLKDRQVLQDVSHKFLHDHPLSKQQSKLQKCKHLLQEALQSIRLCVEVLKN